jgi:sulfatase maturation enzyme AslB (radical SAM superfamily)
MNINTIRNISLSTYAAIYLDIYEDFMNQIEGIGLEISDEAHPDKITALHSRLQQKGAIFRNDDKSIYINQISPACVACREGVGSATFFISLQCNRDCYFCFNPNQEHYDYFLHNKRDLVDELDQIRASGQHIHHLALTGGEPLLHMKETTDFFQHVR